MVHTIVLTLLFYSLDHWKYKIQKYVNYMILKSLLTKEDLCSLFYFIWTTIGTIYHNNLLTYLYLLKELGICLFLKMSQKHIRSLIFEAYFTFVSFSFCILYWKQLNTNLVYFFDIEIYCFWVSVFRSSFLIVHAVYWRFCFLYY